MGYYYWAIARVLANVRELIFFQGVRRRTRQLRLTHLLRNLAFWSILTLKLYDRDIVKRGDCLWKPNKYQRRKWQLLRAPWLCTIFCFCLHIYLLSPGWISISMAPEGSLLIMQNSGETVCIVFMIRKKIKTAYNNTKRAEKSIGAHGHCIS